MDREIDDGQADRRRWDRQMVVRQIYIDEIDRWEIDRERMIRQVDRQKDRLKIDQIDKDRQKRQKGYHIERR